MNINVVGSSGSGKSTLVRHLARVLTGPSIELDALFWQPDWTPCPAPEFLDRVERALSAPGWVLDGNYDRTRALKWATVDVVIWLDLPIWRVLAQVLTRTLRRSLKREVLWASNRETWRKALFSRYSFWLWAITNLGPIRQRYQAVMADPRWQHIVFIQVRTQADLAALRTDPLAFLEAASQRTKH